MTHDKILIVDFGSQVTQLIARRVREEGVYCEIVPFNKAADAFAEMKPRGVILSGGPASLTEDISPRAPQAIFDAGVPVLGICYGEQAMAAQLGGAVEGGHHREFGRADVEVKAKSSLFETPITSKPSGRGVTRSPWLIQTCSRPPLCQTPWNSTQSSVRSTKARPNSRWSEPCTSPPNWSHMVCMP